MILRYYNVTSSELENCVYALILHWNEPPKDTEVFGIKLRNDINEIFNGKIHCIWDKSMETITVLPYIDVHCRRALQKVNYRVVNYSENNLKSSSSSSVSIKINDLFEKGSEVLLSWSPYSINVFYAEKGFFRPDYGRFCPGVIKINETVLEPF